MYWVQKDNAPKDPAQIMWEESRSARKAQS